MALDIEDMDLEESKAGLFSEATDTVEELNDHDFEDDPDIELEGPEAEPEGEHSSDSKFSHLDEMDYTIAQFLLGLFDDTRASFLSMYAAGSLDSIDKYRFYTNLEKGEHSTMVKLLAWVVNKYRLSNSPIVMLLIGLAASTFTLYMMAREERQERKAREEEEEQKAASQKEQPKQTKAPPRNGAKGKPILKTT